VRQGDPLAAIIFIILMDGLHAGFKLNPLHRFEGGLGYAFQGPYPPVVHSPGYADDTGTLTSGWEKTQLQHMWLLDFFVAHHFRLNSSKSYCVIASGTLTSSHLKPEDRKSGTGLRYLPNIDESLVHDPCNGCPAPPSYLSKPQPLTSPDIITHGPTFAFRYLGLMLRVDMGSKETVSMLNGRVWSACKRIKSHSLKAGHYLREYVYPRLEMGLIFSHVPAPTLQNWDSLIRSAVLGVFQGPNVASLTTPALWLALGVLPLVSYSLMVKAIELGSALRSGEAVHARTSRCRFHDAVATKKLTVTPRTVGGDTWLDVTSAVDTTANRQTGVLKRLLGMGIRISYPIHPRPYKPLYRMAVLPPVDPRLGWPVLQSDLRSFSRWEYCPPAHTLGETIWAFKDGSYSGPDKSGYATILCKESSLTAPGFRFDSNWCVILRGGSPHSGANYSAECAAIVVTLKALPTNCPLRIVTDALSAKQSIGRPLLPVGRRLRLGARSLVVTARDFTSRRSAATDVVHVHSHTEGTDVCARGNAAVDSEAEHAAADCSEISKAERDTPFLSNEESFVFWERRPNGLDCHVSGDLRDPIKRLMTASLLTKWGSKPSQGSLARAHTASVKAQIDAVRRHGDADLLLFLLLALTRQLPTANRTVFPLQARTEAAMLCTRCGKLPQTSLHPFLCVSVRDLVRGLRSDVAASIRSLSSVALASTGLRPEHRDLLRNAPHCLRWYDPTQPRTGARQAALSKGSPVPGMAIHMITNHDRHAGILGILPPGLPDLICPNPQSLGLSERHHKRVAKSNAKGLASLRLSILMWARRIFERWYGHAVSYVEYVAPRQNLGPEATVGGLIPKLKAVGSYTKKQIVEQLEQFGVYSVEVERKCGWVELSGADLLKPSPRGPSKEELYADLRNVSETCPETQAIKPRSVKKRRPLQSFGGLAK